MQPLLPIGVLALVAIASAIWLLTRQDTKRTGDAAYRVEQWLVRVLPPTGKGDIGEPTWFGLTIRRLAHIAEFAALGIAASVVCVMALGPTMGAWLLSAGASLLASLLDELHKVFVPGRHFDPADLVLDAAGYLPATALTTLLCFLVAS